MPLNPEKVHGFADKLKVPVAPYMQLSFFLPI